MQATVKEGEQAQHAPHPDQPEPAQYSPERGCRQRQQQKSQRPIASSMGDFFDGIRAQLIKVSTVTKPSQMALKPT